MCLFATGLSQKITIGAIHTYIAAIKFYMRRIKKPKKLRVLNDVLEGIKRTIPQIKQQKVRLPIRPQELGKISKKINNLGPQNGAMLWAACLIAYYAFMRVSEFTTPCAISYKPDNSLMRSDIKLKNKVISINIRRSKTDQYRQGKKAIIAENKTLLCPVKALKKYLKYRGINEGPLFIFESGEYLTPKTFNKFIKSVLKSEHGKFTSHSFRIGAASAAAKAGCPKYIIKQAGRWRSDVYQ